MPSRYDIPAADETPRPVPVDPETAQRASLAVAWRVAVSTAWA
ncbi:MAG: hypothetical protein AVDCRST_MAG68-5161 [uncultured Gemmatimonadetes bacterium]|uniref:Uncharacterized protein n=1 Tax=uncultured Gemmatimonadota bacterium TaxID=203437 RepID=A0A6J4MPS9_9BACT|nr:MAG: hypothetical protein AVDCRST_MAG68-5161 [uncultured Gemmatimonadota bacterium]